jgi:hypothetical protein
MFIPFNELPDDSRVWVYQSSRTLTHDEKTLISKSCHEFIQTWQAHGRDLQGSFKIEQDIFLIIGVNERAAGVTGCSIDQSVALVKELQTALRVDFFDRQNITLKDDSIHMVSLNNLKKRIKLKEITEDQLFYDTTINSKAQLISEWPKPLKHSWMARFFEKKAAESTNLS